MSKNIRSIMTSYVAFVGVGKAGCKIAEEMMNLGYSAYFINSSLKDLSTINAPKNMKCHIAFGQGTNGDRKLAKKYCKNDFDRILNNIQSNLGNFTHIIFCFSGGGGTGSGISPILIKNMINQDLDISYGAICAIPSDNEYPQAKYNSYECLNELRKLEGMIGNIYLINNNTTLFNNTESNLDTINKLIAERFNNTMLIVDKDTSGNVDETEMRAALSISGCCTFADISVDSNSTDVIIDKMMIPLRKGCQFILYSTSSEPMFKQNEVQETVGLPVIYKRGNNGDDFVSVFGMAFPLDYINRLAEGYSQDIEEISNIEEEVIDVVSIDFVNPLEKRRKQLAISSKASKAIEEFEDF